MGLELEYRDGQTPLDEEEKEGLLIATITTRAELDEFEQVGIQKAVEWSMKKKFGLQRILTEKFVKRLHHEMFGDLWAWAGQFRKSNKNLGVDKTQIGVELTKLLDDCRYWIDHRVYSEDEIAVRFSHRMVSIHPFANGNGRHSRLIADILASDGLGRPIFTWGRAGLATQGDARLVYLRALHDADGGDYRLLVTFARQ